MKAVRDLRLFLEVGRCPNELSGSRPLSVNERDGDDDGGDDDGGDDDGGDDDDDGDIIK